jgi:hypothetical protein
MSLGLRLVNPLAPPELMSDDDELIKRGHDAAVLISQQR